jgi:hypothetical protein
MVEILRRVVGQPEFFVVQDKNGNKFVAHVEAKLVIDRPYEEEVAANG